MSSDEEEGQRDVGVVAVPLSCRDQASDRQSSGIPKRGAEKSHGALMETGAGAGTGSRSAEGRSIEQTRVCRCRWSISILPEEDAGMAPTSRSKTFPNRGSIRRPPAEGLCHGEKGSRPRRGAEAWSWLRRARVDARDVASSARARSRQSLLDVMSARGRGERRGEGREEESLFADVSAAPQPHSRRHSVRSKCNRPLRRGRASMLDCRTAPEVADSTGDLGGVDGGF